MEKVDREDIDGYLKVLNCKFYRLLEVFRKTMAF